MSLRNKSIHDLRQIAQSYGVSEIFSKDAIQLAQAIELKQKDMQPKPKVEVVRPEYDARLMTKPPSRRSDAEEIRKLLKPYTDRGMRLGFPNQETWEIAHGKKYDSGNMRMPLRVVLGCAERLMA